MKRKLIIILQNESIFLNSALEQLIDGLRPLVEVSSVIVVSRSPKSGIKSKTHLFKQIFLTFGIKFILFYGLLDFFQRLTKKTIISQLENKKIEHKVINNNINDLENISYIKSFNPDIIISLSCNQIFKCELLELPTWGCLNLHSALLPAYKGLMPTFWALYNQEKYTGISVFKMKEGIDDGPIIVQKKIKIRNHSLHKQILINKRIGVRGLISSVKMIVEDNVKYEEISPTQSTYYSFPTSKDVMKFHTLGKKLF